MHPPALLSLAERERFCGPTMGMYPVRSWNRTMSYVGVSLYYGGLEGVVYKHIPKCHLARGFQGGTLATIITVGGVRYVQEGVTGTSYETLVATDRSDMRPSRELLVEAEIEAFKPRVWNDTKRHGWNVLLRAFRVPQGPPGSISDGNFTRGNQSSCGKFVREPVLLTLL
ncbi:hypothetical protein BDV41DRAFT_425317 [Aspergillus transmontanensis]|uniref:Uncharacterized protein n=1 Tax=Aspergillus transmontanensis TaxID=1034304 RepID=A0A5N6VNC1_9EURO|nr:hypothetical protein BDV41DRAFT_425317 [Aspergillus transmontanensis]